MPNPLLDTSSLPRFSELLPEHVVPAISELIAAHRIRLNKLLEDQCDASFDALVGPVEEMGHELSRVFSPVSHLQGVLGAREWRDAYNQALPLLTQHATELSQDARLQKAYASVNARLGASATGAQRAVVEHALRDFHLSGVDLPDQEKARFRAIMQQLVKTQATFEHNVQDASDAWSLHIENEGALAGLPNQVIERAVREARRRDRQGWLLTLDYPTYDAVMRHADSRNLRESMYEAWVTRASDKGTDPAWDNSGNIEEILSLRHEAAQLVGFENYAAYSLATKMAETPVQVIDFLHDLGARSREAATKELAELAEFAGSALAPWDTAYWLEKLKQKKFSISNEALRQYFPVDAVLNGLFDLAQTLYGIRLQKQDVGATWHADVQYFSVHLFARSGKRNGAWIDECIVRKNLDGRAVLPVGYLVCNFPPPDEQQQSLLAHDDVVTLFHEFGHMLHHLLTRIDYPSIAGINGVPWDAVELPSQFMENFAWHYDVLKRCSARLHDGEPLPEAMFQRLQASRHAGAALAMLRQIEFALFDLRLHSEYLPHDGRSVLDVLGAVRDEVALIEAPDYNRLPHSFSHIFAGGYAAGYYSYKWAEVLAADAFGAFEERGVLDADLARRFRTEILEVGGSRDIMQAYVTFRGRKPTIDALLRQSGISAE
jgi:oligopeptidase A